MPIPVILKAHEIQGRSLTFRDASLRDAEFILALRTNEKKSLHLSNTPPDPTEQRAWLRKYKESDGQAYFIIEMTSTPIGTVRLYDAQGASFCWGSWILESGAPAYAAIESALMVYAYAVDFLGFEAAHFSVRKANTRVWNFHERFGAMRTGEDAQDFFYSLSAAAIQHGRCKYERYLPSGAIAVSAQHVALK